MNDNEKRDNASRKLVSQYKSVFSSEAGKAVLQDLININYIKTPTFSMRSARLTTLREGQRNVVLRILTIMDMDPEQFLNQAEEELSHVP